MGRGVFLAVSLSSLLGGFAALVAGGRASGQTIPAARITVPFVLICLALMVIAWTVYIVAFCRRRGKQRRRYCRRIRFEGAEGFFDQNVHEYSLDKGDPALHRDMAVYELPRQETYEFVPPDAIRWQGRRKRR